MRGVSIFAVILCICFVFSSCFKTITVPFYSGSKWLVKFQKLYSNNFSSARLGEFNFKLKTSDEVTVLFVSASNVLLHKIHERYTCVAV